MLISSLNRDMTEKKCMVKIGGDRLENLLPVNEYNALNENKSILVSNLPKKRIFRPSPERTTPPPASTETTSITSSSCSNQQQHQHQRNQDIKAREESDDGDDVVKATPLRSSTETAQVVVSCAAEKSVDNNNAGNDDSDNNVAVVDTKKMKHRGVTSTSESVNVDEKVTPPDERRVAPIIIRASKIATSSALTDISGCSVVGSGVQVEKIEVIRLPAKLSKIRARSPTLNDASSSSTSASSDADQQRIKTIKIKSKNVENSVDIQNGGNKLKKKKRKQPSHTLGRDPIKLFRAILHYAGI